MKETKVEDYRIEKDSIGTRDIPGDVYYGVQSRVPQRIFILPD